MNTALIIMLYEDWADHFHPVKNHLDPNAAFDGCSFETFGNELAYVHQFRDGTEGGPDRVWTIVDCDGKLIVTAGYQHVNRMGYLITDVPAAAGQEYEIYDELKEVPRALRKKLVKTLGADASSIPGGAP